MKALIVLIALACTACVTRRQIDEEAATLRAGIAAQDAFAVERALRDAARFDGADEFLHRRNSGERLLLEAVVTGTGCAADRVKIIVMILDHGARPAPAVFRLYPACPEVATALRSRGTSKDVETMNTAIISKMRAISIAPVTKDEARPVTETFRILRGLNSADCDATGREESAACKTKQDFTKFVAELGKAVDAEAAAPGR